MAEILLQPASCMSDDTIESEKFSKASWSLNRYLCAFVSTTDAVVGSILFYKVITFLNEGHARKQEDVLLAALDFPLMIVAIALRIISSISGFVAFVSNSYEAVRRYMMSCFVNLGYQLLVTVCIVKFQFCPRAGLLSLGTISADKVHYCWRVYTDWRCPADICRAPSTLIGCTNCVLRCSAGEYYIDDASPKSLDTVQCSPRGQADAAYAKTLTGEDAVTASYLLYLRIWFITMCLAWIYFTYAMKTWGDKMKLKHGFTQRGRSFSLSMSGRQSACLGEVSAEMQNLNSKRMAE